jgi:shikimate kinase/3-dehydroquinate synthase
MILDECYQQIVLGGAEPCACSSVYVARIWSIMADMQKIFLIGLSGSGKSTVARLLADQLVRPFFDINALIEKECGECISSLFVSKGEEYFRDCESRVLTQTIQAVGEAAGVVIAAGDGIVLRPENWQQMTEHGIRIYLAVEPEEALRRLQAQQAEGISQGLDVGECPLLAGPDPLGTLKSLLAACSSWYEEAEITCLTGGKEAEAIAHELTAALIGMGAIANKEPMIQHVHVGSGYDVVVAWGSLGQLPRYLGRLQLPSRVFLITDSNIQRLYVQSLLCNLTNAGYEPLLYTVPAGEASKSLEQVSAIYDWLLEQHAERREAIVALGGGVVGDLAGFVAATYLRGVPLIQVPTSLLAQVDAAIGGKTGVNHARGKNLLGAFYHPRLVLVDPATLLTLPKRERTEGWAEVVKYGIILDADLFALLEAHATALRDFRSPPADLLCQIISRSIALKVSVREKDEREQNMRAILNYGHTVAHALENVAGYGSWLHGEAVSLGMVVAAALAVEAGLFSVDEMRRQNTLLQALGLPTASDRMIAAEAILAAMSLDKKVIGKRVHWILPQRIGQVVISPLPAELTQFTVSTFFA